MTRKGHGSFLLGGSRMLKFKWRQEIFPEDWPLLLQADPSREVIESYLFKSVLLEVRHEETLLGLLVLRAVSDTKAEIKSLSVSHAYQNQGIGSQLLRKTLGHMKDFGYQSIEVSTGTTSFGPLYLYQKNGFRVQAVEQDYFTNNYTEELIENGLVLKDRLVLVQSL